MELMNLVRPGFRHFALVLVCLLAACSRDPIATSATDNAEIKVERLFDHDGCTMYRFYDAGPRYFVKCRDGRAGTEWAESYKCGKGTCTRPMSVPGN